MCSFCSPSRNRIGLLSYCYPVVLSFFFFLYGAPFDCVYVPNTKRCIPAKYSFFFLCTFKKEKKVLSFWKESNCSAFFFFFQWGVFIILGSISSNLLFDQTDRQTLTFFFFSGFSLSRWSFTSNCLLFHSFSLFFVFCLTLRLWASKFYLQISFFFVVLNLFSRKTVFFFELISICVCFPFSFFKRIFHFEAFCDSQPLPVFTLPTEGTQLSVFSLTIPVTFLFQVLFFSRSKLHNKTKHNNAQ